MRLRLTLWQRVLLCAIAAVIGLILLSQVEEEGWADAPWLVSILVIGAILLVAISPQARDGARPAISKSSWANNKVDEGGEVVRERFTKAYKSWSDYLKGAMVDRAPGMPKAMKVDLEPHADLVGLKVAFATYLLVIARRSVGSIKGEDARVLRVTAGGLLTRGIHKDGVALDPAFSRDKALEAAVRELAKIEASVMKVMEAFKKNDSFPMDPLWQQVERELPLGLKSPADRESFYGMKLRNEIGKLLV